MSSRLAWLVLAGVWFGAATAEAVPFTPRIDFRSGDFASGNGLGTLTASASGYSFELHALAEFDGVWTTRAALSWSSQDGFGIKSRSYEDDEIEGNELLRLEFTAPVFLERVLVTDLFWERVKEVGSLSLDGGANWIDFYADGRTNNGVVAVPLNAEVKSVLFSAAGKSGRGNHEFSLAGFDARQIAHSPEPGAGLLLSAGLIALARLRRR